MKITLEWLEQEQACKPGINWFLSQQETDGIKVLKKLREEKEWEYFVWLAPRLTTKKQAVEWACFAAEQVLHPFEQKFPQDERPRRAIEAVRAWLQEASEDNRKAARVASDDARVAATVYTGFYPYNFYYDDDYFIVTAAAAAATAYVAAAAAATAADDAHVLFAVNAAAKAAANAARAATDDADKAIANVAVDKIREAIMTKALEILTRETNETR